MTSCASARASPRRARTVATLALGSLLSSRLLRNVIGVVALAPPDDELIDAWVAMVLVLIGDRP